MEYPQTFRTVVMAIPEHCKGCPNQNQLGEQLASLIFQKYMLKNTGLGLMGEAGEDIRQHIKDSTPDEYAESLMSSLVKSAGCQFEQISKEVDDCMSHMTTLADNCSGTLKMRAQSSKDETTYTVSICTSKIIYAVGQTVIQPAHVEIV